MYLRAKTDLDSALNRAIIIITNRGAIMSNNNLELQEAIGAE